MRPQLEYCSAVWDSYEEGDVFSIEKMQRRAARFDTGDYDRETSVKNVNVISTIGWQSLEERRAITQQTLMHKIVHGLVDICTATLCPSGRQTCRTSHLSFSHLGKSNKNCYRSSFSPFTISEWNSLPFTLRGTTSVQLISNMDCLSWTSLRV